MIRTSKTRRKKHLHLTETLAAKVNLIRKEHSSEKNIDYEYYLITKDEFYFEPSHSEESNSEDETNGQ
jgi:hypothetical protein